MARKPSDIVSPNLRIREDLRARLEKAAKRNDVSINREMINRLEDSFDSKPQLSLEQLEFGLQVAWAHIERATIHHPNLQAGLINASEALLAQLDRPLEEWDPAAIAAAAAQVKTAINTIEVSKRAELRQLI